MTTNPLTLSGPVQIKRSFTPGVIPQPTKDGELTGNFADKLLFGRDQSGNTFSFNLQGPAGAAGAAGLSAYQIAVAAGFAGTQAQWLASLKGVAGATGSPGAPGVPGAAGAQGAAGPAGASAYELAVAGGYAGTQAQWLASIGSTSYWYMQDPTWIRAADNKKIYTPNEIRGGTFTLVNGTEVIGPNGQHTTANCPVTMAQDGANNMGSFIARASGQSLLAGMTFYHDNYAIKLGVRHDGFFGLGGFSSAPWKFYVDPAGNVCATDFIALSDPRLKENFQRIRDPLGILAQLDGGTFNWKHGYAHTAVKAGNRDYGVLADQVEAVMPELVTQSIDIDGESYRTVAYDKLVPVLIEANKALLARIEALEAKLGGV